MEGFFFLVVVMIMGGRDYEIAKTMVGWMNWKGGGDFT